MQRKKMECYVQAIPTVISDSPNLIWNSTHLLKYFRETTFASNIVLKETTFPSNIVLKETTFPRETTFQGNIVLYPRSSNCFIHQNFKYVLQNQIWLANLSGIYLNQKQLFTDVYSHLQESAFLWVSFLLKLQAYSLKKDQWKDVFSCEFCLIF